MCDKEDFHEVRTVLTVLTVLTALYSALDAERGFAREPGFVGQVQRLIRIMALYSTVKYRISKSNRSDGVY